MGSSQSQGTPEAPDIGRVAEEAERVGLANHPRGDRPELGYGTAGFRCPAERLEHVLFRMGVLASLRSKTLGGKTVGVMITASHNPECDNGVKLVEPMGEMLAMEWEAHATALANAPDAGLAKTIVDIAKAVGADMAQPASVVIGRDTRKSSERLCLAAADGAGVMRPTAARVLGLTTTPQLHYVVRCENTAGGYGVPSLLGYEDKLVNAYKAMVALAPADAKKYEPRVVLDCANGVGAAAMRTLLPRLREGGLEVELRNTGDGELNSGCGADFVKMKQCAPSGVQVKPGARFVTFDGDADRVLYFTADASGAFRLLDGDKIALLLARFMADLLRKAGIEGLRLGLVQTAYANGASTVCAEQAVGAENVICAKTGVKHCHHAAMALDVGVYFEANGHGTVLFSDALGRRAAEAERAGGEPGKAARLLLQLKDVINEAVGDAVSIFLAVEAVLRHLDWSCEDWLAMYTDLPNRQVKVVVADRGAFETTDAERKCTRPEGLQAEVDKIVQKAPRGRSFVRPSGTEDVVRVYAEAETVEATVALAQAVVDVVYATAGGVGTKPVVS